jgi:hypothetical protein
LVGFDEAVAKLAVLASVDPRSVVADERERWRLYEKSLLHVSRRPVVLGAVRGDDNGPLASAAVVRALGLVLDAERATWVRALPVGKQRRLCGQACSCP